MHLRRIVAIAGITAATAATTTISSARGDDRDENAGAATSTPIKHLVVIFQENVSFDHYFGTYPRALNPGGEPSFTPGAGTPTVNGFTDGLLTDNPNKGNPHRLDRSEALTCDQDHDYTPEQSAADHGAMDRFVEETGSQKTRGQCDNPPRASAPDDYAVMDYYDGNTTTALWTYAQHFAMSDNSYGTTYGPSTPGALNVVAGNTYPVLCATRVAPGLTGGEDPDVYDGSGTVTPCPGGISTRAGGTAAPGAGRGTVVGDPDPYYDTCSNPAITAAMGGRNIGNQLDDRGLSWGWFEGGFASPGYSPGNPASDNLGRVCTGRHYNIGAGPELDGKPCIVHAPRQPVDSFCVQDYSPHHQPFEYYASTANPTHVPPATLGEIGHNGQANHQYDLSDFWAAADAGSMPAVSYLKAPKFQDGHAGYSDPLDEQHFLVDTLNHLQRLDSWKSTMVVINYDDSDGWYDHVMAPVLTQSQTPLDTLTNPGRCGPNPARVPQGQQARCGYGPRLPLLVLSPWAKRNYVDHGVTDQSSIVRFVEDNWGLPRIGGGSVDGIAGSLAGMLDLDGNRGHERESRVILDPQSGQPRRGDGDER